MRTVKLVLIGPSGVGKSALRGKYITGRFFSGYRTTIGADFITKTLPHPSRPEDSVSLQIWDTAGQERFSSLSNAFFRGADAAILIFDVNNPESMESLTKWWTEFCERAPLDEEDVEKFCCVVVGNKIDLDEGGESIRVTEMEALEFLQRLIPPSRSYSPPAFEDTLDTHSPTITNGQNSPHSNSINIKRSNSAPKHDVTRRLQSKVSFLSSPLNPGTVSSIQSGISTYHTPSSSLFDEYHSAPSSPPLPDHCNLPKRQRSSTNASSSSSAETVTPSLFARGTTEAETTILTIPDDAIEEIMISLATESSPSTQPPSFPPYRRPKLFFTSAKTGEGVSDVFEYIAERVVRMSEYEEQIEARRMHIRETSSTIRLRSDSDHYGRLWKWTCCST
ncbi:ras domain containing protein [Amanita muscaria]